MYNLVEDFGEIKQKFPESKYCYQFFEDDKTIGAVSVNNSEEDALYLFIRKELRGNGYGKILFAEILKKLKENNYQKIIVQFNKKNMQMLKIIDDYNGMHISTDCNIIKYLIPIEKD